MKDIISLIFENIFVIIAIFFVPLPAESGYGCSLT